MPESFAAKFNAAKKAAGLTHKQIAAATDRSEAAVYFWSTGATKQPDAKALPKLAKLLGVSPEQLVPKANGAPAEAAAAAKRKHAAPPPVAKKAPAKTAAKPSASLQMPERPAGGISAAVAAPTEPEAQPAQPDRSIENPALVRALLSLMQALGNAQTQMRALSEALSQPLMLNADSISSLAQRVGLEIVDRMGMLPTPADPAAMRFAAIERRLDAIEARAALPSGRDTRRP